MFATKRRSEMLRIIRERQTMSVTELISMFDESAATIRKDLTYMAENGLVTRTRGEVHIKHTEAAAAPHVTPFDMRSAMYKSEKRAIAKEAIKYIQNVDSILLDSGSSTYELAGLIAQHRCDLTIVTNSLPAAQLLSTSQNSVFLAGGMIFSQNSSTQGPETEQYISKIEADKAFIGATGAKGHGGLYASSPYEESLKRRLIKSAHTVYALVDHSKFNKTSMYLFADYKDIDYIITDKPVADEELRKRIEDAGTKIIVAE